MVETFELPLFPLRTVLFPGMYLPLHIFEERYKEMMHVCLTEQRPFGVVFTEYGETEPDPLPDPQRLGCTAVITQMQPLAQGRMNIMSVGQDRFRVLSLSHKRPYLVGEVELAPLVTEQVTTLNQSADKLYPLVMQYLDILARLGKIEFDKSQIPTDPHTLAYLAASLIQVPVEQKQYFLAQDKASQLSYELQKSYRHEISLLRLLPDHDETIFSLN